MCAFTEMSRLFIQHQLAPGGSLQAYLFVSRLVGPWLSGLSCHGNSDVSEIRAGQFYLAQFLFCIIAFLTLLLLLYTLGNGMRHVCLNIKNTLMLAYLSYPIFLWNTDYFCLAGTYFSYYPVFYSLQPALTFFLDKLVFAYSCHLFFSMMVVLA